MRGKVVSAAQQKIPDRITPAYAGKSCTAVPPALSSRDHPRLCGEKEYLTIGLVEDMGSPPPMRGKARQSAAAALSGRITPAYAGKSIQLLSYGQEGWDHPRLCGEKIILCTPKNKKVGSPPPMRGKELDKLEFGVDARDHPRLCGEKWAFVLRVQLAQRITPAYAGKSGKLKKQGKFRQDHPRLCGEKPVLGFCILRPSGSPPPMRGKVTGMVPPCPDTRITPAYAGKSLLLASTRSACRDHPRLCGEKGRTLWVQSPKQGSPPPMRGKDTGITNSLLNNRITPAYAGKRSRRCFPCPKCRDHPRLCGEKGKPLHLRHHVARITPAYAGKSQTADAAASARRDHPRLCGEKFRLWSNSISL